MTERFHQFPNLFSFVEVGDEHIVIKDWLQTRVTLPVRDVRAEFHGRGFFSLFGYGDVTFAEAGTTYKVEALLGGKALRDHVVARQKPKVASSPTPEIALTPAQKKEAELKGQFWDHLVMVIAAPFLTALFAYGAWSFARSRHWELLQWIVPALLLLTAGIAWVSEIREARKSWHRLREFQPEGYGKLVPEGVVVSRKVVAILEPLPEIWDKPLRTLHPSDATFPIYHVQPGDWVQRGQQLYVFTIPPSAGQRAQRVAIRSPVSGLLLEHRDPFSRLDWPFILLPENEPPPLPASAVFAELSEFCSRHRQYIFQRAGAGFHYADAVIDKEVERLKSVTYSSWDVASVTSERFSYVEMLEERSRYRPDLKRALRKILSVDEARSGASEGAFRTASQHEHAEPNYRADQHAADGSLDPKIKEALDAFGLRAVPATLDELSKVFWQTRATTPKELWATLKEHYEVLNTVIAAG